MSSSCIPSAAIVAAAADKSTTATSASVSLLRRYVVFPLSSNHNHHLFSQSLRSTHTHALTAKSQLNNAGIGGAAQSKSEPPAEDTKNGKPSTEPVPTQLASEDSISDFISQVATLVKLVDSRDIVELEMKQLDCELLIRKKEAISQASPSPAVYMQPPAAPTPPPPPPPAVSPAPAPPAAKPAKSSAPPLKSPMAGTFYRSPAPGAPAFVKVGDKVQKGQIVCIIEAMKLMNEIEADQSGTVVDIVAEDGKPVSLDSPLLVIQP